MRHVVRWGWGAAGVVPAWAAGAGVYCYGARRGIPLRLGCRSGAIIDDLGRFNIIIGYIY